MSNTANNVSKYKLVDTETGAVEKTGKLTHAEAIVLNYAYALNGSTKRWKTW